MSSIEIKVFNLSAHMWAYISSQVEELVQKLCHGVSSSENSTFELNINGEDYVVTFGPSHTSICLKYIYQSLKMDAGDVDITEELLPPLVRKNSTFGCIQFFFVYCNNGLVDIYELDENNHASVNRGFSGDVAALVKSINLYYSKKFKVSKDDAGAKLSYRQYFNLPQFFECQEGDTVLRPCLA